MIQSKKNVEEWIRIAWTQSVSHTLNWYTGMGFTWFVLDSRPFSHWRCYIVTPFPSLSSPHSRRAAHPPSPAPTRRPAASLLAAGIRKPHGGSFTLSECLPPHALPSLLPPHSPSSSMLMDSAARVHTCAGATTSDASCLSSVLAARAIASY